MIKNPCVFLASLVRFQSQNVFDSVVILSGSGGEMRYAKVTFSNLAGGPVVITAETNIPMANKEVDLYPGSQATLDIQSSINEPVVFSAKNKESGAIIELNGESSFEVQPTTDPAYNVSVSLNSAESKYCYNCLNNLPLLLPQASDK